MLKSYEINSSSCSIRPPGTPTRSEQELNVLNRIVTAYLEVAELQALNRQLMYMADWIERLNAFLTMTGKEILQHAGSISHERALEKAHEEYEEYKKRIDNELSNVEKDYIRQIDITEKRLKKANKK